MPDVVAVEIKDAFGHGGTDVFFGCLGELRLFAAWASSSWTRGQT
jgi:hypothetical protein